MKKCVFIVTVLIPLFSFCQIINIPADYPTIQEGINAAQENDIILVDTGTYYENIDFLYKNITVASNYLYQKDSSYIFNTIIDGSNPANPDFGSVVTIAGGQDTTSVLYGFTITGGSGFYVAGATPYRVGGGIVTSTGCKIESNIITDNHCINDEADGFASGGAISAGPVGAVNYIVIKNNLIFNNSAWANGTVSSWDLGLGQGGGIYLAYSGVIEGNIIHSNWCKSTHSYSAGGGIRLQTTIGNTPLVIVRSNEIYNNESISSNATGFGVSDVPHPYLHATSLVPSVVDLILATKEYCNENEITYKDHLFLTGYSEGGYLSLMVQKTIEEEYQDELHLTAVAPMSGPYDLEATFKKIFEDANYSSPAYVAYILTAYNDVYQWNILDKFFQSPYAGMMNNLFDGSRQWGEVENALPVDLNDLMQPDFKDNYCDEEGSCLWLAFKENTALDWVPEAPIHFIHGDCDDIVYCMNTYNAMEAFLANGADDIQLTILPGENHETAGPLAIQSAINWIEDFHPDM